MKKEVPSNYNKTNRFSRILIIIAAMAMLVLLSNCFHCNEVNDETTNESTVLIENKEKNTDLLLNQDSLFDSWGSVYFDCSCGDRFNYRCFSSLCVTRLHSFDEKISYAEFYVEGYKTLSGVLFIDDECKVYSDGSVSYSNASILIYADGKLIKTFNDDYNIKTRSESFTLDIENTEFVKIVFNDCYGVETGMYQPSVVLGDLMVSR